MGSRAVWYEFAGSDRSREPEILAGLADAGVNLQRLDEEERTAPPHGILCCSEVSDAVIQMLRDYRRRARGMILALAVSPAVLQGGSPWRLLHAGAADALVWGRSSAVASQVRARLDRWITVDELAEEAAERQPLIGASPAWRAVVRRVVEAAYFSETPVLLIGESGTGKEVLSRLIHTVAERASELVTVDCSTIVAELSGSELFGHEKGAYTGAVSYRDGAFALASGGTLFLDEVGELPLALQPQLLRAVQEKTYKRVGGNVWQNTDFRLVCATNRDLTELVERGQFRLDLYHRIAGWVFRMPALRERREDILPLAEHFMKIARPDDEPLEFDSAVRDYLVNHEFPGNVRELRQLVQRIAHRHAGSGPITAGDIPEEDRPLSGELSRAWPDERLERTIADAITMGVGLKEISQATTDTAIRIAVQSEKGNLQRAAKRLGVTDRALQMRRKDQRMMGA